MLLNIQEETSYVHTGECSHYDFKIMDGNVRKVIKDVRIVLPLIHRTPHVHVIQIYISGLSQSSL